MSKLYTIAVTAMLLAVTTAAMHMPNSITRFLPSAAPWRPRPERSLLYFTEQLEPKFSGGEVRNAAGARVDKGKSISGNVMQLRVGALSRGTYSVTWHVLSVDTHKTQGNFSFTVAK